MCCSSKLIWSSGKRAKKSQVCHMTMRKRSAMFSQTGRSALAPVCLGPQGSHPALQEPSCRAFLFHPEQSCAGVKTAGESNTDFFTDREGFQDSFHDFINSSLTRLWTKFLFDGWCRTPTWHYVQKKRLKLQLKYKFFRFCLSSFLNSSKTANFSCRVNVNLKLYLNEFPRNFLHHPMQNKHG